MSISTVLLHAAADSGFSDRLAFAVRLAKENDATIKALYTLYPAGIPRVGRALAIYIKELVREAKEKEAGVKAQFEAALSAGGVKGVWHVVEGEVTPELSEAATYADIAIVSETQHGTFDDDLAATLPEHLALSCNGPVVVVPTGKPVPARIGRVLVAWKPSREAGHAIRFALPVLAKADAVQVLTVGEGKRVPDSSGVKLSEFLTAHGVKATHSHVDASSAGEAIVSQAEAFNADLIVLGAYSRSRLAELVLGGVTASLLSNPPRALLFAH